MEGRGEEGEEGLEVIETVELPESLRAFLASNNVPEDAYSLPRGLFRFVRLNPRRWSESDLRPPDASDRQAEVVGQLKQELGDDVEEVPWLPTFYRLPHSAPINNSDLYQSGRIYGIDASSGAAVVALDPRPGDNVLDLCCAPGAKLCMIADMLQGRGTVTGVDVSDPRLGACRNLVAKYDVRSVRLILHDGTTFDIRAPPRSDGSDHATTTTSASADEEAEHQQEEGISTSREDDPVKSHQRSTEPEAGPPRKKIRHESSELIASRWRKKLQRKRVLPNELHHVIYANPYDLCHASASAQLYDKVMIDAQCTLDASVRHILQFGKLGWKDFTPQVTQTTVDLQKRLLANGFRLLAPGGSLVYSTCSFSREQNEDVVEWLLSVDPSAKVVPIEGAERMPCSPGMLAHTLRFYPRDTHTSGLFIAKLTKLVSDHRSETRPQS